MAGCGQEGMTLRGGLQVTLARRGESFGKFGYREEFGPVLRFARPISRGEQHRIHPQAADLQQVSQPFAQPIRIGDRPVSISHSSPCE
jgi:hypothetical protein